MTIAAAFVGHLAAAQPGHAQNKESKSEAFRKLADAGAFRRLVFFPSGEMVFSLRPFPPTKGQRLEQMTLVCSGQRLVAIDRCRWLRENKDEACQRF